MKISFAPLLLSFFSRSPYFLLVLPDNNLLCVYMPYNASGTDSCGAPLVLHLQVSKEQLGYQFAQFR